MGHVLGLIEAGALGKKFSQEQEQECDWRDFHYETISSNMKWDTSLQRVSYVQVWETKKVFGWIKSDSNSILNAAGWIISCAAWIQGVKMEGRGLFLKTFFHA